MTVSTIGQLVTISPVDISLDFPTRVNIKKRRETVVYETLSNENNINISYLIGEKVTPTNNLFISDKSTSLTQNRILSSEKVTVDITQSISLNTNKFLVTDIFTEETSTLPETPLFFEHTLKYFNSDLADFSNRTLLSIEFADYTLNPISITEHYIDTSTGKIYNNIENSFNSSDQSFSATFVKYTVQVISGSTQAISVYHELIDNSTIFDLADFDDIDVFGNILPGLKKYLIEEQPNQQFLITLPSSVKYAWKEMPEARLQVLSPTAIDLANSWNVRVSNGEFISSLQKTATTFLGHKYYVAEFYNQLFQPYPPYRSQIEQKATWLYDNLILVPKRIGYDETTGLNITIIVKSSAGVTKYAYTTDSSLLGTAYESTVLYTAGILSVDRRTGILELNDNIRDDDEILVSYFAEEIDYEFTAIDFNPINNQDILNQRVVLYVNPETTYTGELSQTLFYLLVDDLGKITYSSQVVAGGGDPANTKLLAEDFTSAGSPSHTFYYDTESTASGLASRFGTSNPQVISEFSFVDKYTVDSVLLNTTIASGVAADLNYEENPRFLVLADIYVGEHDDPSSLEKFDVRVQGGGIKEDSWEAVFKENPEAAWYWDSNVGKPYPSAGAFVAEVPQSLLADNGGTFTREQVTDIIGRHMKAGGYAILKTYGVDPTITSITVGSGNIIVGWPSYGSEVTYDVYCSSDIDTGFAISNDTDLIDVASGNIFTVSGLNASSKYYIKIGATDTDDDLSFGPVVSATTTSVV